MDIEGFLAEVEGFDDLEPGWRRDIAHRMSPVHVPAGSRLMRRGEAGDRMYVIADGRAEIPVTDAAGASKFVAQLGRGDIVGEMALLTGMPRVADVVAHTDLTAYGLHKRDLDPLLEANPPLARLLTGLLGKRLAEGVGIHGVGKFRLLEKVGSGGSATVYAAVHEKLHRVVAAKMLNHSLAYEPRFRTRFLQEARIIARLNHPHIVQVFDTEEAYATFFIMMEFVGGATLHRLVQSQGPLAPARAMALLSQVGEALQHAHGAGLVHRDVKPANCAVDGHGQVKLMDFGIARPIETDVGDQRAAMVEGTPHYMAPEVATGRAADGRADIYSLGVMAFELLTGQHPFQGDKTEVMNAHVREPAPDLRDFRSDLPETLIQAVHGMLVKDRDQRLSDWSTILAMLQSDPCLAGARPTRQRMISLLYHGEAQHAVDDASEFLRQELLDHGGVRVAWADVEID